MNYNTQGDITEREVEQKKAVLKSIYFLNKDKKVGTHVTRGNKDFYSIAMNKYKMQTLNQFLTLNSTSSGKDKKQKKCECTGFKGARKYEELAQRWEQTSKNLTKADLTQMKTYINKRYNEIFGSPVKRSHDAALKFRYQIARLNGEGLSPDLSAVKSRSIPNTIKRNGSLNGNSATSYKTLPEILHGRQNTSVRISLKSVVLENLVKNRKGTLQKTQSLAISPACSKFRISLKPRIYENSTKKLCEPFHFDRPRLLLSRNGSVQYNIKE